MKSVQNLVTFCRCPPMVQEVKLPYSRSAGHCTLDLVPLPTGYERANVATSARDTSPHRTCRQMFRRLELFRKKTTIVIVEAHASRPCGDKQTSRNGFTRDNGDFDSQYISVLLPGCEFVFLWWCSCTAARILLSVVSVRCVCAS